MTVVTHHRAAPALRLQAVQRIVVPSRLDVHNCAELESTIARHHDAGTARVEIDASHVKHIDKAGLESLRSVLRQSRRSQPAVELLASTTVLVAYELVFGVLPGRIEAVAA